MSKKNQTRKAPSSSIAKTSREKAHSAASAIREKTNESEFAQSGDFFRSLVENSQVCACLKDEAEDMSTPVKRLGGYFPQLIGKADADLFSAATARELRDHDLAAFMSSGIANLTRPLRESAGCCIGTSLKFPVVSASGQKLLAVICLDVTKQKNLEEQLREGEERYRTLAEITSDYAFTLKVEPDRKLTMNGALHLSLALVVLLKKRLSTVKGGGGFLIQMTYPRCSTITKPPFPDRNKPASFVLSQKAAKCAGYASLYGRCGTENKDGLFASTGPVTRLLSGNAWKSSCENG